MPIYLKDKQIVPFKGDHKPVNIYQGTTKLAGWKPSPKAGEELHWDDTYNDTLTGMIGGKSIQAADYVYADGVSSQVSSVWGTNRILNGNFANGTTGWTPLDSTLTAASNTLSVTGAGTAAYYGTADTSIGTQVAGRKYYIGLRVRVLSAATWLRVFGTSNVADRLVFNMQNPVVGTWYTVSGVITPVADFYNVSVYAYTSTAAAALGAVMEMQYVIFFDLTTTFGSGKEPAAAAVSTMLAAYPNSWFDGKGLLATDIITYTPNSPSPDYPAPITTNIPAGTYKITMSNGEIYEFALPDDVRGLTGAQDRVVFDRRSKKGWASILCGKHILTGTSPFIVSKNDSGATSYAYYGYTIPDKTNTSPGLCTHFKHSTLSSTSSGQGTFTCNYSTSARAVYFNFYGIVTKNNAEQPNANEANAWLAAQYAAGTPVTVIYRLATPVRTPLTFTKVATSSAPEFPASALTVIEQSPDYQLPIYDAAGTVTARGRSLFDKSLPLARTIGAVKTETATGIRMANLYSGGPYYGHINLGKIKSYAGLTLRLRADVSSNVVGQQGAISFQYSDYTNFIPSTTLISNISSSQINITFTIPISYAASEGYLGLGANASRGAQLLGDWLQYDNLMLEPGSIAHPYLPYRAPSSHAFALPGIPLPASAKEWTYIDDTGQKWWADTDEWGKFDGVWRWRRTQRCGIYTFTGSENNLQLYHSGRGFYYNIPTMKSGYVMGGFCNRFKNYGSVSQDVCIFFGVNNSIIYVKGLFSEVQSSIAPARDWLTANPMTILYQLATPIITYHDDPPLLAYPWQTDVAQDADIKAYLSLDAKVIDR